MRPWIELRLFNTVPSLNLGYKLDIMELLRTAKAESINPHRLLDVMAEYKAAVETIISEPEPDF